MKVFITGGGGYIGSVFVRELLDRGDDVTVMDTMFFGDEPLKDVKDRITLIKKDIRKIDESDIAEGTDAVVDFAAMSNDPSGELDNNLTYSINHLGRYGVAKASKRRGVRKYIAPSSCAIYGASAEYADETSPVSPISAYAKANYAWENDILPMADKDFCVTVLRQATVYGPSYRMRLDLLVNDFTMQAARFGKIKIKGDGNEFRPFVHIKDDGQAFIKVMEAEPELINGQIFNVGSNDQNIRVRDLISLVQRTLNKECTTEFGELVDKRNYKVLSGKIANTLGFKAKRSIADGVREVHKAFEDGAFDADEPRTITVKWYKELISRGLFQ